MKPFTFKLGQRVHTANRLTALIGVVSLLLLAVASYGAWRVKGQQDRSERILSRSVDGMKAAAELELHIQELRHELELYLWRHNLADLELAKFTELRRAKSERASIDLWLRRVEAVVQSPQESALVGQVKQGLEKFYAHMSRLDAAENREADKVALAEQAEAILDNEVLPPARKILTADEELLDASRQEAALQSRRLARLLMLIGVGGALLAMLAGYSLARTISQSLLRLHIPIQDVAGKLSEVAGDVVVSTSLDFDDLGPALQRVSTEVSSVVEQLHAKQREMVRADQLARIGQLAAGLAHEIRNPLMAMKMLVQAAQVPDSTGLDARDLQILDDEIRRLEVLLTEFLDFARPGPLEVKLVDVRTIVESTINFVQRQADARQVLLQCSLPAEPLMLKIDAARIRQVLLNLLLNAIQATPSGGGVRVAVELKSHDDQSYCRLAVSDDGPGIGPRQATRIFEPFYSTKETGLGLGLVVSQRICRSHGGDLALERGDYSGAIFVVALPLPGDDDAPTAATPSGNEQG